MAASQTRIADTISLFYSADRASDVSPIPFRTQSGAFRKMAHSLYQSAMSGHAYKAAVDELDAGVGRELDAPFRATVLEPVGKLNSYYGNINSAIDKRNHKVSDRSSYNLLPLTRPSISVAWLQCGIREGLADETTQMLDYDATRSKVKKMVEKPSDDPTKLPRAQAEHDEARDIFNILNDQLISELPLLVDLRIRELISNPLPFPLPLSPISFPPPK